MPLVPNHIGNSKTVGCHWQSSSTTGCHWQSSSTTGCHWQSSSTTGCHWQSSSTTGCHWQSSSIDNTWHLFHARPKSFETSITFFKPSLVAKYSTLQNSFDTAWACQHSRSPFQNHTLQMQFQASFEVNKSKPFLRQATGVHHKS